LEVTLLEVILYGKWNCIDHFCRNMDYTQIWIYRPVPKSELVVTDRTGAAVMVQACIHVVSGSKLRQATTYAADFSSLCMLYESQSNATFQQHAISAGCLSEYEICMSKWSSSFKNWVPLALQTCIQKLLVRILVGGVISYKKLYLNCRQDWSEPFNL
jgi:hypothetical protein